MTKVFAAAGMSTNSSRPLSRDCTSRPEPISTVRSPVVAAVLAAARRALHEGLRVAAEAGEEVIAVAGAAGVENGEQLFSGLIDAGDDDGQLGLRHGGAARLQRQVLQLQQQVLHRLELHVLLLQVAFREIGIALVLRAAGQLLPDPQRERRARRVVGRRQHALAHGDLLLGARHLGLGVLDVAARQ